MATFQYHPDILAAFSELHAGVIYAAGMTNSPTPSALGKLFSREQAAVLSRIRETPLSELPTLSAWRSAFRQFGVDPTRYRSAPESLLRHLTKKGDIPSINALVDIENLISIRYGLPVAIFDIRSIQGGLTVHFADGTERFTDLGQEQIDHPEPGEVVFSDETGLVFARRWCWRQSEQSSATLETSSAIITIEAQHTGGEETVLAAVIDMLPLLKEYSGGDFSIVYLP